MFQLPICSNINYVILFVVAKPCDLVDCNTGEVLMEKAISRELKRALDQTDIKLSENFDKLGR